jgi:hypothetical protein
MNGTSRPGRNPRVKYLPIRLTLALALSASFVAVLAGPAAAATPVVADDQFKWFYWIGFALALSFVGWLVMMAVGYYVRVLRPKYRGQKQA